MKKFLQPTLLAAVLMISPALCAMFQPAIEEMDARCVSFLAAVNDRPVAFVENDVQACVLQLQKLCPHYAWSEQFNCFCRDMQENGNLIVHADFVKLMQEGISCCDQKMSNDGAYNQDFASIEAILKDCRDFLRFEQSQLNARDEMFLKKRRCCSPCFNSCSVLTSLFISGVNVLPFLPTGPIVPVTTNRFYAYRQVPADVNVTVAPAVIPFTGVGETDNNWSFTGGNTFTALVSGVYLVTVIIPYQHNTLATPQPAVYLFLDPTLNTIVQPTFSVFYFDDLTTSALISQRTFQLENTFIIAVAAGGTLQFQDRLSQADPNFFRIGAPTGINPNVINGSVSIVRIK